jgi:putative membrane protein
MHRLNIFISRFVLTAAITSLPVAMLAQTNKPSAATGTATTSTADKKFVRAAAQGGMAEVELGKLATEKGSSEDVKKFGQRMVDDHTKAGDQLKEIASSKGIPVPIKLSAKDQMTKDRLSKLSGDEFDKAYMNDMVKDHTQDVSDFKRESSSGTDSDVKNFAATTLPTIEDHLREAKKIAPKTTSASNNMKGSE